MTKQFTKTELDKIFKKVDLETQIKQQFAQKQPTQEEILARMQKVNDAIIERSDRTQEILDKTRRAIEAGQRLPQSAKPKKKKIGLCELAFYGWAVVVGATIGGNFFKNK